mgnify:CR=1 FL=1
MLQEFTILQFDDDTFFQQDGAPPQYANVKNFLDEIFPRYGLGGANSSEIAS